MALRDDFTVQGHTAAEWGRQKWIRVPDAAIKLSYREQRPSGQFRKGFTSALKWTETHWACWKTWFSVSFQARAREVAREAASQLGSHGFTTASRPSVGLVSYLTCF